MGRHSKTEVSSRSRERRFYFVAKVVGIHGMQDSKLERGSAVRVDLLAGTETPVRQSDDMPSEVREYSSPVVRAIHAVAAAAIARSQSPETT